MRRFCDLFDAIDRTTSTNAKVAAMSVYFRDSPRAEAAWALFFLSGRRINRLVPSRELSELAVELGGISPWLFDECYSIVGDLAETVSLLVTGAAAPTETGSGHLAAAREHDERRNDAAPIDGRSPDHDDAPLHEWVTSRLLPLRGMEAHERRSIVRGWLATRERRQVFMLVKLMTGALRVGVSATLVTRALGEAAGLPADRVADRLMGDWQPTASFMDRLLSPISSGEPVSRPYPFYLASPIEERGAMQDAGGPSDVGTDDGEPSDPAQTNAALEAVRSLGRRDEFQAEWKWDGIRAQLIRRGSAMHLWSRGEELLTDRFPEISEAAARLPGGCVLDGEVLAYRNGRPLPFAKLQRRIGRVHLSPAALADAPAVFMAYDLLEHDGTDVRATPLSERRRSLERLVAAATSARLILSPTLDAPTWDALAAERTRSREIGVEGLMLKRLDSTYGVGRERGSWWKWKIEPYAIDAVLTFAQPGHGRRANLLTDYTFGVWENGELVTIAKAYSGLSNAEIAELDAWIRRHTTERFGPVRGVEPAQVFELHFENIALSTRHRGGVAVRFPRIARWRRDKTADQADTLDALRALARPGAMTREPGLFD